MKRTIKNAMSIFLAFTLIFGSFAFGLSDGKFADFALKAEAETLGDYTYSPGYLGIRIISVNKSISGDVVVPAYFDGKPVAYIDEGAFSNCTAIESVTLPDSVRYIWKGAFYGCTSLESITIECPYLVEIGYQAFAKCKSLKSIVIPDGVETLGSEAFQYCENLTSVTLPNSITSIYSSTFSGCKKLENITIPNTVTEIRSSAFENCESLSNITIPEGVTKIGSYAFYGCEKLEGEMIIPASVTSIGSSAFENCKGLERITVKPENTEYSSDEQGVLFNKDKTELIQYPAGNTNEIYIIPDGVTKINLGAFYRCDSLKTIVFPDGVTHLNSEVVVNCTNLECIHIPPSVIALGIKSIKIICSSTANCYAKEFADENDIEFRVCTGHNTFNPEPTTKPVVTEPSTTKPVEVPTTTKPVITEPATAKPIEVSTTKPSTSKPTTKPVEPTKPTAEPTTKPSTGAFIFKILKPSVSVIKYGETLILHTNLTSISADEKIEWSVEGSGVTINPSADVKTCAVTSTATGDVTITAKYTDSNGVEHVSEQEIKSNASFWQKIVSFFKNLFRMNRIIEQIIKF